MNKTLARQNALKNVLIIHTDGNSFNNPSLKCLMDLLLGEGCEIDLRYPKSKAPMPDTKGIRLLPFGKTILRLKTVIFDRVCSWPLVFLSVFIEKLVFYKTYDLIIGVDRQGLIEAHVLNKITKIPYIFISFEIMFEGEISTRCKSLERTASKNAAIWLVQDEVRAEQLQHENSLQPSNRILLPLASAGVGIEKVERLRDRLGIPHDKSVAISIGSVDGWSMTNRIIKCVAVWPEEWVLVVHERYGRTRELFTGKNADFADLLGRRIFISDAATKNVDDMGGILAGVAVGLAFYEPDFQGPYTGKNLEFLGLASGKISTYLRYGVPVIMNEVGLYAEEARQFRFGCVVTQPEDIRNSLEEISHEEYRQNAVIYFTNKLDFNNYKNDIWSRLLSINEISTQKGLVCH